MSNVKSFKVERRQTAIGTLMTRGEYNVHRGWTLPEDENGDDEGVMLINGDHVSWVPKDIFEKECTIVNK